MFVCIHAILPLVLGLLIYIMFRPNTMIARLLIRVIPPFGNFSYELGTGWLALLLKNYVCDMLWAYALTISLIWYGQMFHQPIWKSCIISIVFAVCMELAQLLPFVAGTFDIIDICAEMGMVGFATWISMFFTKKKIRGEQRDEEKYF